MNLLQTMLCSTAIAIAVVVTSEPVLPTGGNFSVTAESLNYDELAKKRCTQPLDVFILDDASKSDAHFILKDDDNGPVPGSLDEVSSENESAPQLKVPEQLRKNFSILVSGYEDNQPIKIYSGPNEKLESSSTFQRPDYFWSKDFNIYNGKYLKVEDSGGTEMYVDVDKIKYQLVSTKNNKKKNKDNNRKIISNEKNYTTNITSRTNLTSSDLTKITKNTKLHGIEDAVVKAEEDYGVNSIFILAVAALESGWGESNFAMYRNNLFGICAYDNDVNAASSFASKGQCIDYFGRLISKEYFAKGYTDPFSINTKYASSTTWGSNVYAMMQRMIGML